MRNRKVFIIVLCAMGIALNIILGTIVEKLNIPLLFLDTIGTILAAALFGPWYGAAVGTITNVLSPIISGNPKDIPFFLVNAMVGIVVGYMAKRFKFGMIPAVISGIILAVLCPLVGSPIAIWLYGGITGSGNDFIFTWLRHSGADIFQSAFVTRIASNIIDKIGSCILVSITLKYLPKDLKKDTNLAA